jgi:signal transduction histidine kinase
MPNELFEDMKAYISFGAADAHALAGLAEAVRPALPAIVEEFYSVILRHPNARSVLGQDGASIARLKALVLKWLTELFGGDYGEAYFQSRSRIGRVHVQVGLPQQYMFTAMSVIRLGLIRAIWNLGTPQQFARQLSALHKLLDLELAIMNLTYREDLVKRIQDMERAEYEARISESQHLATIGQLAASLAHEIKNPLAGISGAIQVLGAALPTEHPHKDIISEALKQIDRLDAAVKDLLIYARPKPPEKALHDLGEIIERALMILRQEPDFRKVRLHCEGLDRGHSMTVDATQIQQVVTNLLINAAHACERGGDVYCRLAAADGLMRIVVEDTGVGIAPHVLAKAFEPFYTTKARGTGLGLSICKRIVESHGGTLRIDSQVGRGTRVTVEIPETSAEGEPASVSTTPGLAFDVAEQGHESPTAD